MQSAIARNGDNMGVPNRKKAFVATDLAEAKKAAFEAALKMLRPFSDECPEDKVRGKIEEIIQEYKSDIETERESLRLAEIVEKCKAIRDWAERGLLLLNARCWGDFDFLRYGISRFFEGVHFSTPEIAALFDIANLFEPNSLDGEPHAITALVKLVDARSSGKDSAAPSMPVMLCALEKLAQDAITEIEKSKPDVGGGVTHFKNVAGSAKHRLVMNSVQLFDLGGLEIRSKGGAGKIREFVGHVFEAADGREAEGNGVGLKRYLEFNLQCLRKHTELREEFLRFEAARNNVFRIRPADVASWEHDLELARKKMDDFLELWKLGPKDRPRVNRVKSG